MSQELLAVIAQILVWAGKLTDLIQTFSDNDKRTLDEMVRIEKAKRWAQVEADRDEEFKP